MSTLFAMAQALDVPVDAFFRDTPPTTGAAAETAPVGVAGREGGNPEIEVRRAGVDGRAERSRGRRRYLVRRGDRDVLRDRGRRALGEPDPGAAGRGSSSSSWSMRPARSRGPRLYRHPGQEIALVLTGRLDIHVGFERSSSSARRQIAFPSTLPHRYVNPGEDTAHAVTTILRDGLPEAGFR